jgi:hypothetical protein
MRGLVIDRNTNQEGNLVFSAGLEGLELWRQRKAGQWTRAIMQARENVSRTNRATY